MAAAAAAFVAYLTIRHRGLELGYELGRTHAHLGRLREVKRVLELELASHETPERIDVVARTLFGMSEPTPARIVSAGARPAAGGDSPGASRATRAAPASAGARPAPGAAPELRAESSP